MGNTKIEIISFFEQGLNLPKKDLPLHIRPQKRKRPATNSTPEWKICGADTETINGRCYLFSTEKGAYYIDSLFDLMTVLYNRDHASKWTRGKKSGRKINQKSNRGYSTKEFYFYNLKFDAQAIFHYLDDEILCNLLNGDEIEINVHSTKSTPIVVGEMLKIRYLEGKMLEFKPQDWFIGQYKIGPCVWWDISQFYGKKSLNQISKEVLQEEKVEKCFDGTILDVTRLGEESYRERYHDDVEKYAIQDAILAGKLTRHKRAEYISQDIRFIKPYSVANVAQRNLLDSCDVPVINPYIRSRSGRKLLQAALSAYQGGWFECSGAGKTDVVSFDLTSAYPYSLYHLDDTSQGYWIHGDNEELWWKWCDMRKPMEMGFAEVYVVFEEGMDWHPLVKSSPLGTLVAPQMISGWFTADEIIEARKWPHIEFIVGEWYRFTPESTNKPFRNFINKFYELKENSPKNSVSYEISKIQINSCYGKLIQCIDDKTGSLWNPMWAATTTGFTRARLAEIIRYQDFKAVSVATDGVAFRKEEWKGVLPPRPLPAPYTLGEWEEDGEGEMLIQMSGVYSIKNSDFVKTVFRGSASYFLKPFLRTNGLFGFCVENSDERSVSVRINKPYSAKEARAKSDMRLMNVFEERTFSMKALGDSTKRRWRGEKPSTFGDLMHNWYVSTPHRNLEGLGTGVDRHA